MGLPAQVRELVRRAAALEGVVLATDFDGTLAPFVDDPMTSRAADGAIEALREAAALPGVTVALVSGRDLAVLRLLSEIGEDEPIVLIGTHGAQSSLVMGSGELDPEQADLLAALDRELTAVAEQHPGARVERKPAAVVLHTRGMDEPENSAALDAASAVAQVHPGCHPLRGKNVQEIGVLAASKGSALVGLARHVAAQATVYLGDDVTDERAFAALDPARGDVTIKVGEGETAAVCRVGGVPEAVEVLAEFVSARREAAPA